MDTVYQSEEDRIQFVFKSLFDNTQNRVRKVIEILEQDPNPIVRHESAYILGEIAGEIAINALIKAIQIDKSKFVVHEAMLALGTTGNHSYMHMISEFLNSKDSDIRQTAQITIQRMQNTKNSHHITYNQSTDFSELDEEGRIQFSFHLLNDRGEKAIDTMIKMLRVEKNPIVKHEIIFSLGEVSSNKVILPLTDVLNTDTNIFVVHESLLSLGTIGSVNSIAIIEKFLKDPRTEISMSAKIALERIFS